MKNLVITIGREYGSGGRLIARKLAESLNIPFYDKELISLAAKKSGFAESYVQEVDQKPTKSFLYNFYMSTQAMTLPDQVFLAQSEAIREAGRKGSCVIVGRCAGYVLQGIVDCLKVFIYAPMEERIQRVKEEYQVEAKDYRNLILRKDKERAAYHNYFTTEKWGKCQNYDLSINSTVGIDTAAKLIETLFLDLQAK